MALHSVAMKSAFVSENVSGVTLETEVYVIVPNIEPVTVSVLRSLENVEMLVVSGVASNRRL